MSVHYLKHCGDCVDNKLILDDDCDWLVDRINTLAIDYKRNRVSAIRVLPNVGKGAWPIGRAILEFRGLKRTDDLNVCHLNDNPLDCETSNLIYDTPRFNSHMKGAKLGSTSKYKGVSYSNGVARYGKPWAAQLTLPGQKHKHLGYFATEDEAGLAYNQAVLQAIADGTMSPLSYLNPIPELEGDSECQNQSEHTQSLSLKPEMLRSENSLTSKQTIATLTSGALEI